MFWIHPRLLSACRFYSPLINTVLNGKIRSHPSSATAEGDSLPKAAPPGNREGRRVCEPATDPEQADAHHVDRNHCPGQRDQCRQSFVAWIRRTSRIPLVQSVTLEKSCARSAPHQSASIDKSEIIKEYDRLVDGPAARRELEKQNPGLVAARDSAVVEQKRPVKALRCVSDKGE